MGRKTKHRSHLRSGKKTKKALSKKAKKSVRRPTVAEKRGRGTLK
jgi:hypothetical protein